MPAVDVTPYVPDVIPVDVNPRPVVITLLNPAETRAAVNYSLAGTVYTLEPGQSASHGEETQEIAFDRGGSFGEARYTLAPGTYRFVSTDHGWDLHSVTSEIAGEKVESAETTTTVSTSVSPLKLLNGG